MFSAKVAIANQYACQSIIQADKEFEKSCEMCCNSPQCLHHSCERCKVAEMHQFVVEMLAKNISAIE